MSGVRSTRGYAAVALDHPKTPANVGSVLRLADNYGAAIVVQSGDRYKGAPTDTFKTSRHKPLIVVDDVFDAIPFDCVPVAVDLIPGAKDLRDYKHPRSAFYIFGPEDGTLGKRILDRCRDVVYVPTHGCMNLAATVAVVLYDRFAKEEAPSE